MRLTVFTYIMYCQTNEKKKKKERSFKDENAKRVKRSVLRTVMCNKPEVTFRELMVTCGPEYSGEIHLITFLLEHERLHKYIYINDADLFLCRLCKARPDSTSEFGICCNGQLAFCSSCHAVRRLGEDNVFPKNRFT